jgi:hypothetical protein
MTSVLSFSIWIKFWRICSAVNLYSFAPKLMKLLSAPAINVSNIFFGRKEFSPVLAGKALKIFSGEEFS